MIKEVKQKIKTREKYWLMMIRIESACCVEIIRYKDNKLFFLWYNLPQNQCNEILSVIKNQNGKN
jgi:hypothetical protein